MTVHCRKNTQSRLKTSLESAKRLPAKPGLQRAQAMTWPESCAQTGGVEQLDAQACKQAIKHQAKERARTACYLPADKWCRKSLVGTCHNSG